MRKLEEIFYEFRPYCFLALGLYILFSQHPSPFGIACVLVLVTCAAVIIRFRLQARKGSTIEQIIYDFQPILYLGLGAFALVWLRHSKLALACAFILLFCGTMILRWRLQKKK